MVPITLDDVLNVGNPPMTARDRALSSPLSPIIPVRNDTQLPPGTAVTEAPLAAQVSGPPPAWASSSPVPAAYSSTTPPPVRSSVAPAYRFMPPGPSARLFR